jgi:hypothetical protein
MNKILFAFAEALSPAINRAAFEKKKHLNLAAT